MIANVKIEQSDGSRPYFRVYKDGQEITRVRHVDANFDGYEFPTVNVEIVGGLDFEGMADIHFDYSPYTIKESCMILREELLKHGDLYNAFLLSIQSALKEASDVEGKKEAARIILNRIIGEEAI